MSSANTKPTKPAKPSVREALGDTQEFLHAWAVSQDEPDLEACALIEAVDEALAALTPPSNRSNRRGQ